jgi:cysteine desulfurase
LADRLGALRNQLAASLKAAVPDLVINAEQSSRAPHLLSVAFPGTDSEALIMHLDLAGVAASSGSACSTGAVEPSHVLIAMGVARDLALGTIRFSLGRESSLADIERATEVAPAVVAKVRKLAEVLGRADGRTGGQTVGDNSPQRGKGAPSEATVRPPDRQTAR